jgi:polysaccharide biosynthesis/export protein
MIRGSIRFLSRTGLWLLALALCLQACGGDGGKATRAAIPPTAAESEYRIGPGDKLRIFVWNQPEISGEVPVRPDGNISAPLIEDVVAAGKTPTELARDIEKRLAEFIRTPQVNVIVVNFQGTGVDQIKVVGAAVNPRALPYRSGMTLMDVMIDVGGLSEFASGNRGRVIRIVEGKQGSADSRAHGIQPPDEARRCGGDPGIDLLRASTVRTDWVANAC